MQGRTISHYQILSELGRGGMGVVYRARDTKLNRDVALKFLPADLTGDDESRTRLMREAQAAAALSHPGICTIHEIDEFEGQSFIAMEYVAGRSLKQVIGDGPLKLDEAVDYAIQMAGALQEAHERGIVHRDIKPANIMIAPGGRVKVMDFGLAKLRGQTKLTREGTTLGTVAYMSPEQARGDEVDRRTDIWSLGALIYEMLTGRGPFQGEYEQAAIYSILNNEPEPVTALRTGVPMELERVVTKALAKIPGERYQTAADLAADLRCLRKKQHAETTVSRKNMRGQTSKRQYLRVMWALLAIVLAFPAIQLIQRIFPSHKVTTHRQAIDDRPRIVVLPFENLGSPDSDYFAEGITEEITSRLAAIHELGVISRNSALHYKDSDKTTAQIGAELDIDYVLEGTVRWEQDPEGGSRVRVTPQLIRVSDDSHVWADRYDEDFEAIFDIQTRIAERVAAELDIALTGGEQDLLQARPTENTVAYQVYLRAADYILLGHRPEVNYLRAEKLLEQVIDIDPGFALAHAKLSHVHRSLYFYGYIRTEERLRMAKEEIDRALELDSDSPEVRRELGYYYYQGLLDYDRALEIFMALAGTLPDDAQLLQDIAFIWRRQGHFEQALANLETAYSMSPIDAGLCVEVAYTNIALRRPETALKYAERILAIAPESHMGYFLLGAIYLIGMGDVQKAREAYDACPDKGVMNMIWARYYISLMDRDYQSILDMFETSSLDVIRIQSGYLPTSMLKGHACKLMGDDARAKGFYEDALKLLEAAIRENPEDPRIHSSLGSTYAGLGRKAEAIEYGRKAVRICPITRDAILGVDRMVELALIYARVGESDAAIKLIREILTIPAMYTIYIFEIDPRFDSLREEPAYGQLVREFGGK